MAQNTELGKLANQFIAHGNLVPDAVVNDMMHTRLAREDCEGFILDGFPRTLEQAEELAVIMEELGRPISLAVNIEVPDDVIVERAIGRQVCTQCGAIYHLKAKPPHFMGICDNCRAAAHGARRRSAFDGAASAGGVSSLDGAGDGVLSFARIAANCERCTRS